MAASKERGILGSARSGYQFLWLATILEAAERSGEVEFLGHEDSRSEIDSSDATWLTERLRSQHIIQLLLDWNGERAGHVFDSG